ncbi:MAG: T9SS type A sorting domain-containing protein [Candidatus Cloacimonetes bacterium]|nr:T9SS type A sorting domain-containing protein [Candidatus Cloacimonadota bacterium]
MNNKNYIFILIVLYISQLFPCTIGIIRADLTNNQRPLIWKSRDSSAMNISPIYNLSGVNPYVGIISNSVYDRVWMGVNVRGFAMLNSLSLDLQGTNSSGNGQFIAHCLANYSTITELENYLNETNDLGRATKGNFAVIDGLGNGAMYEIANNDWVKYDVNDDNECPEGFIIRTNFSFTGGSLNGIDRYNRAYNQIETLLSENLINVENIKNELIRDFSINSNEAYDVPFLGDTFGYQGYINIDNSICNETTTNATIIEGILNSEDIPIMWNINGFPVVTPIVPYIPRYFNDNMQSIIDLTQQIKYLLMDIEYFQTLLNTNYFIQDDNQGIWDILDNYDYNTIQNFYQEYEDTSFSFNNYIISKNLDIYYKLNSIKNSLIVTPVDDVNVLFKNSNITVYPNPAKDNINIKIDYCFENIFNIEIFNIKGQKKYTGVYDKLTATIPLMNNLNSGVYVVKVYDERKTFYTKFLKIK